MYSKAQPLSHRLARIGFLDPQRQQYYCREMQILCPDPFRTFTILHALRSKLQLYHAQWLVTRKLLLTVQNFPQRRYPGNIVFWSTHKFLCSLKSRLMLTCTSDLGSSCPQGKRDILYSISSCPDKSEKFVDSHRMGMRETGKTIGEPECDLPISWE